MARRPAGTKSFIRNGTGIADAVIKANPGILYAVNISWTGGAADDLVHIHDCLTVADITDGNRIFSFRADAAAGKFAAALPAVGKEALLGLVLNVQASGAKWSIDVSYD